MAGKGQRDAGGISMLGDEILLKVLEKVLDRVDRQSWCLVCKEFLFLEASCRKYVHLLRSEILAPVLERYNRVEHLDLSSCVQVTDANLQTVGKVIGKRLLSIKVSRGKGFGFCGLDSLKECTSLQEVDLTNCLEVGDREVASLSRLSSLQSLKLTGCRKITDAGLATLARCKELRVLILKWCVGLADSGIGHVASNCKKLHTLDLSFTDISDRGLASLAGLEHLEHLSLISCNNLSDWGLNCLRNGCKALQTLDAAKCSNVSSFGVIALADSSLQLQQLNLSYCKPISTLLFQSLQNLKMLQSIKLDGCNIAAADLGLIGKCCKELKEFSVSKCQGVTDAGIRGVVAACTGLHKLDLTCCRDLTDTTMDAVAAGCRGLLSLKMENCCLVTAEGLALIGIGCPFLEELDCTDCNLDDNVLKSVARCAALRLLKVGYCMNITNSGLFYIGMGCKNLREFDCYRSVGVGDPGVAAIANGCSRLKVINLSYCASITDESLLSISQLRDLVQLELRACVLVTSVGISCVAASCKHLKELDTKRCSFVDDSGILAVAKGCPNLRQINMSYTAVTNVGMMAIARMSCMQDMKLVHLKNVTSDCFAEALLACGSLKKVKLLTGLRMVLPTQVVKQIEDRGTRLRWMEKLA